MSDDVGIPGYLLWRAANLWQKRIRAVLAPYDVTPVQYLLLAGLRDVGAADGGSTNQAALARHCQTDPMMTSQVLRVLEKAGLIARQPHAGDGRAFAIALTGAGAELLSRAEGDILEADALFHDPLGGEKELFGDALRLLSGVRPRRRVKAVTE
ncbi:MAG: MarR family transcriptional regulator [Alphaproteobacteria bacterium]|nr:MarR family transcriptional regulator [Alphaproteobacteria bacterium]